jgi:DNA polymerase-3 subunit gamma/tau
MSTEVWYRKWRPQRFADVAGQEHVTRTLTNAVAGGRVAHAYLFCGPRGTGKTSTARVLAKAANCQQNDGGEPCNRCASCVAVGEGRALDLVEMDAASNRGINEIRSLRDKVGYSPTSSTYKVYLIDEVHELTAFAFDALLKTLEEPPPHVIFVLATTDGDRVPATVASRCQRFDFRRIRLKDVVNRLRQICAAEEVTLPDAAYDVIGRRATGSLRDAVNLLEQVVAACGSSPSLAEVEGTFGGGGDAYAATLVRQALAEDLPGAFNTIAAAREDGGDPRQLQRVTLERLRALLLVKAGADAALDLGDEPLAELRTEAGSSSVGDILRLLSLISAADFRADPLSPLPLELAIARAVIDVREPANLRVNAVSAAAEPATRTPERAEAGTGRRAQPPEPRALRPTTAPIAPPLPRDIVPFPGTPAAVRPAGPAPTEGQPAVAGEAAEPALQRLQGLMGSVYDQLKERRSRASSLVNSHCNVVAVEEDSITLAFKHDFLAARIKSEEGGRHLLDIEDVIESLSGHRYRLEIRVDPDVQRWMRATPVGRTSHLLDEAERLGLRREGQ